MSTGSNIAAILAGLSTASVTNVGGTPTVTVQTASGPVTITGIPLAPDHGGVTITGSSGLLGSGTVTTRTPVSGAGTTGSSTGVLTISNAGTVTKPPSMIGGSVSTLGSSGTSTTSMTTTASEPGVSATTSGGQSGAINTSTVTNNDGTQTTFTMSVTPGTGNSAPTATVSAQTVPASSARAGMNAIRSLFSAYWLLLLIAVALAVVYAVRRHVQAYVNA